MPNYCDNNITINGSVKEINHFIKRFKKLTKKNGKEAFDILWVENCHKPKGLRKTSNYNLFGCDYLDIHHYEFEKGYIQISGSSNWRPLTTFFERFCKRYKTIHVINQYSESGVGFAGVYEYNSNERTSNNDERGYIEGCVELHEQSVLELLQNEYDDCYESYEELMESEIGKYLKDYSLEDILNVISFQ